MVLVSITIGPFVSAQSCLETVNSAVGGSISKTTGNVYLDQAFNRELNIVSTAFGVRPAFFMADDRSGPNALAFACGIQPGSTSTLVFGGRLTAQQLGSTGSNNYTIPAILAHEFTHVVQNTRNIHPSGKSTELQADFMAGWYIARVNAFSPDRYTAIAQSTVAFFQMGDNAVDPEDTDPHGLKIERADAIQAGMRTYAQSFEVAWTTSLTYVGRSMDRQIHTTRSSVSESEQDLPRRADQTVTTTGDEACELASKGRAYDNHGKMIDKAACGIQAQRERPSPTSGGITTSTEACNLAASGRAYDNQGHKIDRSACGLQDQSKPTTEFGGFTLLAEDRHLSRLEGPYNSTRDEYAALRSPEGFEPSQCSISKTPDGKLSLYCSKRLATIEEANQWVRVKAKALISCGATQLYDTPGGRGSLEIELFSSGGSKINLNTDAKASGHAVAGIDITEK